MKSDSGGEENEDESENKERGDTQSKDEEIVISITMPSTTSEGGLSTGAVPTDVLTDEV
jgi:hypothetical protein